MLSRFSDLYPLKKDAHGSDFAPLFEDLSKSEKHSETKPPLYSSHVEKVLLLLRIGLERSHQAFLCVKNELPIS